MPSQQYFLHAQDWLSLGLWKLLFAKPGIIFTFVFLFLNLANNHCHHQQHQHHPNLHPHLLLHLHLYLQPHLSIPISTFPSLSPPPPNLAYSKYYRGGVSCLSHGSFDLELNITVTQYSLWYSFSFSFSWGYLFHFSPMLSTWGNEMDLTPGASPRLPGYVQGKWYLLLIKLPQS